MAITACPHCHKSISLTAVGATGGVPDNALGRVEMRAVRDFLATQRPGRQFTAELYDNYDLWRREIKKGAPKLTKNALARAVRAHGAISWRNALGRGWVLPEITAETPPARPAPSVIERENEQAYRDSVTRSGRPSDPAPPAPEAEKTWAEMTVEERLAAGHLPF